MDTNLARVMPRQKLELTLRELLEAQPALQRLSQEKLPIKTAYNVARMLKALQPELDEFFTQRMTLIKKYGTTRATTDEEKAQHGEELTEVLAPSVPDFRKDIDELVAIKISIDREPLKLDGLPDMTPADLIALEPLFEE